LISIAVFSRTRSLLRERRNRRVAQTVGSAKATARVEVMEIEKGIGIDEMGGETGGGMERTDETGETLM
jgi:hypothetical protein